MQSKTIHAINPKWLASQCSGLLGFTHCTQIKMLIHLLTYGAIFNNINIQELISAMDSAWTFNENPPWTLKAATKLKNNSRSLAFLLPNVFLHQTAFKGSGIFDAAMCEQEAKPKADQTFTKFHPFLVKEISKANTHRQMTQTAGYSIANNTETANSFTNNNTNLVLETTAKLVNAVTNQNNNKLDELIKFQTETPATFQKLLIISSTPSTSGSN